MRLTITWHPAPNSIWAKLAERLGREPNQAEADEEVRRILREARETARASRR